MKKQVSGLLVLFVSILLVPTFAVGDETIVLTDNTKIVGKIVHYFDGVLTVSLPSGSNMKLPQEKIRTVQFQLPKPRPALSTPEKTFERLRKAALKGDVETYLDSHSTYYQMFLNHQIMQVGPQRFRKQLKKEWANVQLKIIGSKKQNGMAILKVRRQHSDDTEEGEFRFVKENGEWKMILPL